MRDKKVTSLRDNDDPFFFHYLSLPENPQRPPQPEIERTAFDDVNQRIDWRFSSRSPRPV